MAKEVMTDCAFHAGRIGVALGKTLPDMGGIVTRKTSLPYYRCVITCGCAGLDCAILSLAPFLLG
jgi:hypothetical protein